MVGIGSIVILAGLLMAWLAPQGGDLSQVRIGFAGYEYLNGARNLVLVVTNGSAYRITVPGAGREVYGASTNGQTVRLRRKGGELPYWPTGFGMVSSTIGRKEASKRPSIARGVTHRFTIPVEEGPFVWQVTVPLQTIPAPERLPRVLRAIWPSARTNTPVFFKVVVPPIPPEPQ
jgi:hypothetical protein